MRTGRGGEVRKQRGEGRKRGGKWNQIKEGEYKAQVEKDWAKSLVEMPYTDQMEKLRETAETVKGEEIKGRIKGWWDQEIRDQVDKRKKYCRKLRKMKKA